MKRSSYIGFYLVFAGVGLIVLLIKGLLMQNERLQGFPGQLRLVSELIMSVLSIIGGFLLVLAKPGGRRLSLFSLGMMLYSVINGAGYYWQTEQSRLFFVFVILAVCTLGGFIILLTDRRFSANYKLRIPDKGQYHDE
jgi:hypothetical protein